MHQNLWRIAADVPGSIRTLLLRTFPPRFEQVFCRSMTWAYKVGPDFDYPTEERELVVLAHHLGDATEALICRFGEDILQPLAPRQLFITLSTAAGVPPTEAGRMFNTLGETIGTITPVQPVAFQARLQRFPLWKMQAA